MHQRLDNLDTRVTAQASNLKWHGQRILDDHKITLRNLATDQATSYANGLNDIQERAAMSYQNRLQEINNTAADTIAAQVETLQIQPLSVRTHHRHRVLPLHHRIPQPLHQMMAQKILLLLLLHVPDSQMLTQPIDITFRQQHTTTHT